MQTIFAFYNKIHNNDKLSINNHRISNNLFGNTNIRKNIANNTKIPYNF